MINAPKVSGGASAFVVRDIAHPFLSIPTNSRARRVPRFPFAVGRSTVVQHPPIGGPVPAPAGIETQSGRIFLTPARHHVTGFSEAAGIEPVAAKRRAVILQFAEAGKLAPSGNLAAINFLGHFFQRWAGWIANSSRSS